MSDAKTYFFGNEGGSSNLIASIIPLLQQRGIDPNMLLGMIGNKGGAFGGNGIENLIGLVIVLALLNRNGNGNGLFGGGGGNNSQDNYAYDAILSAIQRNGTDISQLAQTIGVSSDRVHDTIGQLSTQICNFAGQNGLSFQQVINSIQAGNASVMQTIADCCCRTQTAIQESNYLTERGFCNTNQILTKGFSDLGYVSQNNTRDIENTIKDSTQQILAGQAAIEKRELQREIETLREEKQTYKLGNMMAQNNAPLAAAINALQSDVDGIKCRLPRTEVIPATPEYVPINRSINVGYSPYYLNGYNAVGWNNGCCGNTFNWG